MTADRPQAERETVPDLAGLVAVLNSALAMNRYASTCVISLDTLLRCRDALAAAHVWQILPAASSTPGSEPE